MAGWPGDRDGISPAAGLLSTPTRTPGGHDRPPSLPGGLHQNPNPTSATGVNQPQRGFGGRRTTAASALFNTIVPPNSTQYPFAWCSARYHVAERLRRALPEHQQQPPRRLPTSCSPTAASISSSRRSPSRPTGRWGPRPTARSSRPIATDLWRPPRRARGNHRRVSGVLRPTLARHVELRSASRLWGIWWARTGGVPHRPRSRPETLNRRELPAKLMSFIERGGMSSLGELHT